MASVKTWSSMATRIYLPADLGGLRFTFRTGRPAAGIETLRAARNGWGMRADHIRRGWL